MKNNLYTKAMVKIKAPKTLVDSALEKMNSTLTESEVITMEKPKRRALKFTSAIAAVLALIIGLGVIISTDDNKHSFVITAGAAEVTKDMYVEVGEYDFYGSSRKFYPRNQEDPYNLTGEHDILYLMEVFQIEGLMCSGENIDTITYTAHNSKLSYKPDYYGLLNVEEIPEEEMEEGVVVNFDRYLWASSCTYDFNSQKETVYDEIDETYVDLYIPLKIAFTVNFEKGEHVVTLSETGDADTTQIFMDEFNARADKFLLDVTANFEDGATVTKTLQFKCDGDNGNIKMYAMEV